MNSPIQPQKYLLGTVGETGELYQRIVDTYKWGGCNSCLQYFKVYHVANGLGAYKGSRQHMEALVK